MFQLTNDEVAGLRFQNETSKRGRGGRRYLPYVFTDIAIMRTFVQLRRLMDSNADLARKIEGFERKYDEKFAVVFAAIKQLITPP